MNPRPLMVMGTSSGAGEALTLAAHCPLSVRASRRIAPFKARNRSLNSAATFDGFDIYRTPQRQDQAVGKSFVYCRESGPASELRSLLAHAAKAEVMG